MPNVLNQGFLITQPKPRYGVIENLAARTVWSLRRNFKRVSDALENTQHHSFNPPPIAFPQARKSLLRELQQAEHLGTTTDGKQIYLCNLSLGSSVLKELGRLREIAFRCVGEGSNLSCDIDRYDVSYVHIVLWDERDLEIVGAYRLGEAFDLVPRFGNSALYTNELFRYDAGFEPYFTHGVELGRSFVQPGYWGKRSLDYLWQGIGAYLKTRPQVKYLFGAVSISNDYPELAKQQIAACYRHHFSSPTSILVQSRMPYYSERSMLESYRGQSLDESLQQLQTDLRRQNLSIPTLLKHYTEFCDPSGTHLLDFNVDPRFNHCIDGLMLVELDRARPKKRARYLNTAQHST
jgi:hypothetical protein